MELKHKNCFFGLGGHFTVMSTVVFLVAAFVITSVLSHFTKYFLNSPLSVAFLPADYFMFDG